MAQIYNTTTNEIETINIMNEYDSDQTLEVMENCSDFTSYAEFDEEIGLWKMNGENLSWWKALEEDNVKFASLLDDNDISVGEFQNWLEEQGYGLSCDLDTAEREKIEYLNEMISER